VTLRPLTAQAVAELVGGRLVGPGEVALRQVRSLERAEADALAMCVGGRHVPALASSRAGAVLVPEVLEEGPGPRTRIVVADPARAMAIAAGALHPEANDGPAIHPTARIGLGTTIGDESRIDAYAIVGTTCRLGSRVRIGPHVVIADDVTIGDDVRLDAHVIVYGGAVLGDRVYCKAGAVIGGPGFGFVPGSTGHERIPQVGGCILGDDVDVGSHTAIDRGSLDDTVIGRGTKIDNLVQIAHNVRIGSDCLIMAGVGIAGSARIGDRVIIAGQAGVGDHRTIGDDARVAAQSGVSSDVAQGVTVSGFPIKPHREFLRAMAATYRLAPHVQALEALAEEREDA
jgi:UDP-3-O-[3-hydroxymyristoyl] glucosamine N-acyltransferase